VPRCNRSALNLSIMGMINDLKKLLFGAAAVGKSATGKIVEEGKAKGAEFLEHSETALHQAKEKTSELLENTLEKAKALSENVAEKTGAFIHHTAEKAEELFEKSPQEKAVAKEMPPAAETPIAPETLANQPVEPVGAQAQQPLDFSSLDHPDEPESTHTEKSAVEKIGGKVMESALEAGAKVEKAAEEIGHKVLDAGEIAMEKFKETAEQVGGKVLEKGGEILERAKEFGEHLLHKAEEMSRKAEQEAAAEGPGKLDELIRKAREMGDKIEEKAKDKDRHFTDIVRENKSSTLDQKDDFFSKAKKFADGDYGAVRSKPEIGKDPNFKPGQKTGKTHGFDDQDGDGEDLIDDAIVENP
jgi:hypothetical protein